MDFSILERFGLNKNSIEVYTSLLGLGRSKTGAIIKDSGIRSARVYESLTQLIEKGLVSYQVRNNIKYYQAEAPHELIEQNQKDQKTLQALSEQIKSLPIPEIDRNETNIYEGIYGFKKALTQHIENLAPNETIAIVAFSPRVTQKREGLAFFRKIDKELIAKKNIKVRMLLDKTFRSVERDKANMPGYTIRYLPAGYFTLSALNISEKEVILSVWGEHPLAISIKNPEMIKGFQKNFEFLWNIAKE